MAIVEMLIFLRGAKFASLSKVQETLNSDIKPDTKDSRYEDVSVHWCVLA